MSPSIRTIASVVVLLVALAAPAHAATFTVASTADAVDASPGDGMCADGSGDCTLRAAVMEANALSGADTITLPAGTYVLTIPGAGEEAGDLDIRHDLTIKGAGADITIIDANHIDRVLNTYDLVTAVISGVTIQNGDAGDVEGGGIWNQGRLTLNNSTVRGNSAWGAGGIFSISGAGPTLTINNSTVSGNTVSYRFGGGIYVYHGTLTLNNSTVSGNSAEYGDAIYASNHGIRLYLYNSTIRGGFRMLRTGENTTTTVKSTILDGVCEIAPANVFLSLGHNLSGNPSCIAALTDSTDVHEPPLLGPLADNGGPTETRALCAGSGVPDLSCTDASPAIDAGGDCPPPATDQRGVVRPQGAQCDIGAYEAIVIPPPHCAFEHPGNPLTSKTGIVDTRLVQAFIATDHCQLCGERSNPDNIETQGGVPAFQPPLTPNREAGSPANGWFWGLSQPSWGRVKLSRTGSVLCPTGDVKVQLWLRKITDATGLPIPSATGSLNVLLRAAVNDPVNGDMTMVDFPMSFPFALTGGAATFSSTAGTTMGTCLPSCANVEVVRIEVLDADGNLFARPGVWLP